MEERLEPIADDDPELLDHLDDGRLELARARLVARVIELPVGPWRPPEAPEPARRGLGLLVLSGLLARRVGHGGRFGAELLGPGDVLRPWDHDAERTMPFHTAFQVFRAGRLAVLDRDFVVRAAPFPEVLGTLMRRAIQRSKSLAVYMAISQHPRVEERVYMVLWHLAGRWGRVRPDGVLVPLRLTHELIGQLVAARRPSVTIALTHLTERRLVQRSPEGWLLRGDMPGDSDESDPCVALPAG